MIDENYFINVYSIVLARYGAKGKRYDTINITQNIAIRCISATSNLTHGRQFVNERLLLLRGCEPGRYSRTTIAANSRHGHMRRRSQTVGDRQCRSATTRYRHRRQWRRRRGDRQVVSCTRSRMIDDVVSSATQPRREQRSQHLARFRSDRADQQRGDEW